MKKEFITIRFRIILVALALFCLYCPNVAHAMRTSNNEMDWREGLYGIDYVRKESQREALRRDLNAKLDFADHFVATDADREWLARKRETVNSDNFYNDSIVPEEARKRYIAEIDGAYTKSKELRSTIVALIDASNRGMAEFIAAISFSWGGVWHSKMVIRHPPLFTTYGQIGGFGSLCTYLAEALLEKMPFLIALVLVVYLVHVIMRKTDGETPAKTTGGKSRPICRNTRR